MERQLREQARLTNEQWNVRQQLSALGRRDLPFDAHLALADELENVSTGEVARLRLLALARSFPNATKSDVELFERALGRVAGRAARFVSDGGLPSTGGLDGVIAAAWPAQGWWPRPQRGSHYDEEGSGEVALAVHRAVVLERALSGDLSAGEAEKAERARWTDDP